jgi:four helix bundle protein
MRMTRGTSYRDLEIYQIAHALGVETHFFTLGLPRFELFETGSQLRRSSKSVSANIVEGFCRRRHKAEFVRYLVLAHASNNEAIEWLEYIRDCHSDQRGSADGLMSRFDGLGRKMNRFIGSVEKHHRV